MMSSVLDRFQCKSDVTQGGKNCGIASSEEASSNMAAGIYVTTLWPLCLEIIGREEKDPMMKARL